MKSARNFSINTKLNFNEGTLKGYAIHIAADSGATLALLITKLPGIVKQLNSATKSQDIKEIADLEKIKDSYTLKLTEGERISHVVQNNIRGLVTQLENEIEDNGLLAEKAVGRGYHHSQVK